MQAWRHGARGAGGALAGGRAAPIVRPAGARAGASAIALAEAALGSVRGAATAAAAAILLSCSPAGGALASEAPVQAPLLIDGAKVFRNAQAGALLESRLEQLRDASGHRVVVITRTGRDPLTGAQILAVDEPEVRDALREMGAEDVLVVVSTAEGKRARLLALARAPTDAAETPR